MVGTLAVGTGRNFFASNFLQIVASRFRILFYALLITGMTVGTAPSSEAAIKDLKLTDKKITKTFQLGKLQHKNRNITAISYKPANIAKPIVAMVFDKFSLAEYVSDPIEKALLYNFQFPMP